MSNRLKAFLITLLIAFIKKETTGFFNDDLLPVYGFIQEPVFHDIYSMFAALFDLLIQLIFMGILPFLIASLVSQFSKVKWFNAYVISLLIWSIFWFGSSILMLNI
tara:strand:- start:226 stop:543 length:318 start_codon:yes stop_codon:yes gene_type:complete